MFAQAVVSIVTQSFDQCRRCALHQAVLHVTDACELVHFYAVHCCTIVTAKPTVKLTAKPTVKVTAKPTGAPLLPIIVPPALVQPALPYTTEVIMSDYDYTFNVSIIQMSIVHITYIRGSSTHSETHEHKVSTPLRLIMECGILHVVTI